MTCPITFFFDDGAWRFARVTGESVNCETLSPGDQPVTQCVTAAIDLLRTMGASSPTLLVALPSAVCLSARVATDGLERGHRRRALSYRLEEQLPVAAEQIVFDYQEQDDAALGICVETDRVAATIQAFEAEGVAVHHIVPSAMLAAMHVREQRPATDVAVIHAAGIDVVVFDRGKPVQWQWFGDDVDAALAWIEALVRERSSPLSMTELGRSALNDRLRRLESCGVDSLDIEPLDAAAQMGRRIVQGEVEPWFDLRRDELARPDRFQTYRAATVALAVGLIVLLLSVIVMAQHRGRQYAHIAAECAADQVELFTRALPDQQTPIDINGRLRSEARKLAGLSGQGGGGADPTLLRSTSALVHLHTLLSSLPPDIRFRIDDLTIEPDRMLIRGETLSYGDAEKIAASLRDTGRYEVDPPRTEALRGEEGVGFTFGATPRTRDDLAKARQP